MRFAKAGVTVLGIAALALTMGAAKKDKGLVIQLKTSDGKDAGTATFKETVAHSRLEKA